MRLGADRTPHFGAVMGTHWHRPRTFARACGWGFLVLILALALPVASVRGETPGAAAEYRVKAAFLYKFAKFVSWPEPLDSDVFTLCVLGVDPFGAALDRTVSGKHVGDRPVEVRRLATGSDVAGCQVLFISSSERARTAGLLRKLEGQPTLTVADMEGFADRGGMINLTLEDRRIRLEINAARAKAANLKIDSALLSLAKVVGDDE